MARTLTRKRRKSINDIVADNMMMVPTESLKRYPKNPRIGDVEGIKESILNNGFAKVLLAQKSTRYVLDGNHTWQAAVEMGYPMVPVAILDVDDDTAARIVLAANRLNDIASYDNDLLAEVLKGLGSPVGTGYSDEDYQALMRAVEDSAIDAPAFLGDDPVFGGDDSPAGLATGPDPEAGAGAWPLEDDELGDLELAEEELGGIRSLKKFEDCEFPQAGYWGIPKLREDMLMQEDEVPDNLKAWAGSATKNWHDPDQWWLYNVGVDSTSGMNDVSKVIVSFYTWDEYFETWWVYPDRWVAKLLNSKIQYAITPDYSMWSDRPMVESLYALYKSRFVGRYMQEAGIKVIPNLGWPYGKMEFFDKHIRGTLPKHIPVAAFQIQTFAEGMSQQDIDEAADMVRHVLEVANADLTIVYSGKQGVELLKNYRLERDFNLKVIKFRTEALAEQAKTRSKKKTL